MRKNFKCKNCARKNKFDPKKILKIISLHDLKKDLHNMGLLILINAEETLEILPFLIDLNWYTYHLIN